MKQIHKKVSVETGSNQPLQKGTVSESIQKSVVTLDRKALEKAKVVFIYRENSFLDRLSAEISKNRGTDFYKVTVPAGTTPETIDQIDREKLLEVYQITKEKGVITFRDETTLSLCGFALGQDNPKLLDDFQKYKHALTFNRTGIFDMIDKTGRGGGLMSRNPEEFAIVLKEMAKKARDYGAENIVVVLGHNEERDRMFATLDEHGIAIDGGAISIKSIIELRAVFEFVKKHLETGGLKVYPGVYDFYKHALTTVECFGNIVLKENTGEHPVFVEATNTIELDKSKTAVFVDRHMDSRLAGYIEFHKHEGNTVEDKKTGEYLPFVETSNDSAINLLAGQLDAFIQTKLDIKKMAILIGAEELDLYCAQNLKDARAYIVGSKEGKYLGWNNGGNVRVRKFDLPKEGWLERGRSLISEDHTHVRIEVADCEEGELKLSKSELGIA